MQLQIDDLTRQVASLAGELKASVATNALNHQQNRKDIHDLRNGQQIFSDTLAQGFDKISRTLKESLAPVQADVLDLKLWRAKVVGQVSGISLLAAIIFRVVEVGLTKLVGH